jgi:hypothetical protein
MGSKQGARFPVSLYSIYITKVSTTIRGISETWLTMLRLISWSSLLGGGQSFSCVRNNHHLLSNKHIKQTAPSSKQAQELVLSSDDALLVFNITPCTLKVHRSNLDMGHSLVTTSIRGHLGTGPRARSTWKSFATSHPPTSALVGLTQGIHFVAHLAVPQRCGFSNLRCSDSDCNSVQNLDSDATLHSLRFYTVTQETQFC